MMGCFSTSHTDGTDGSLQSLKSLLAAKQAPIPSPCMAKKIIERKLGLGTRKTLQARTNLLDTACHNLAKAKQRTLVSFPPSFYITSDTAFFPLPLPPGYKPSTSCGRITAKSSSTSTNLLLTTKSTPTSANATTKSSSIPTSNNVYNTKSGSNSDRIDVASSSSSFSSNPSNSPCHSSSNSTTIGHSSCEDLTPSSSTSSSVFSAAPSFLSQSSSFSSSSTNYSDLRCESDLRCNSFAHGIENENSILTPLPPPSPRKLQTLGSRLKDFSPLELAEACENFDDTYKLRDGAMGPIYKVFLPEQNSIVAIARVATEFSRKRWKAQVQSLAQLVHPNLSKVIGFSYERAKYTMKGVEGMNVLNTGFIVYESFGNESLEEFLQDVEKGHSHIDWLTRLKIAIGIAEGLSFLLEKMPSHIDHRGLTMDNIRVDLSFNAKLLDFDLSSSIAKPKERKSCDVVQAFGNVLLQVFDFICYPQDGKSQNLETRSYPPKDAKLVIDLAASCLLNEASLRPSIRHATRVLQSIEPTQHVAKFSMKRSKSVGYRRKRSLSFG